MSGGCEMNKYELVMREKVFMDKNGKMYLFNVPLYVQEMKKKNYSSSQIVVKFEILMSNPEEIKDIRTINRVHEYTEGYVNGKGKRVNISIETIKQVGLALTGKEYGLLVEFAI